MKWNGRRRGYKGGSKKWTKNFKLKESFSKIFDGMSSPAFELFKCKISSQ